MYADEQKDVCGRRAARGWREADRYAPPTRPHQGSKGKAGQEAALQPSNPRSRSVAAHIEEKTKQEKSKHLGKKLLSSLQPPSMNTRSLTPRTH
jgi:hypothetical protein